MSKDKPSKDNKIAVTKKTISKMEKEPVSKTVASPKTEKQAPMKTEKTLEKPKSKKIKKPESVKKLQTKIKKKKKLPIFRGRFGKKQFRRKSNKKWQKWRKPRGIDVLNRKEDGAMPKTGYRTAKEVRGLHPSGYREVLVNNPKELVALKEGEAARISGTVGKKKRIGIVKEAGKKGIVVLNR